MVRKLILFDLKYSICSGVTLLLLGIFVFLTLTGIYFGRLKLDEIRIVDRGNDKVVMVSNTGSYTAKLEAILDRTLPLTENRQEVIAQFLAYRLVEFWLCGGALLVLIYGYFFLTKEQQSKVLLSLLIAPVSVREYYRVKAFSGFYYWGIFVFLYGSLLWGAAYVFLGVRRFLLQLIPGIVGLWVYIFILWLLYLLVSLVLEHTRKVGGGYLVLVLIIGFLVPGLVQLWVKVNPACQPDAPRISESSSILAFVPERRRTEEENQQVESDLRNLAMYRTDLIGYLVKGIKMEERLAYFSPVLVSERLIKSIFRPEIVYFEEYMMMCYVEITPGELLLEQMDYLSYLGVVVVTFIILLMLLSRYLEPH